MTDGKTPRAAGTRTFLDVLKALGRKPSAARAEEDLRALRNGEARLVACLLFGSVEPYPSRFSNGSLRLSGNEATWRRFGNRGDVISISEPIESFKVRSRDPSIDRGIKSGGLFRPDGPLGWMGFSVLVCTTAGGTLELAVPNIDLPLVTDFLERKRRA